MFRTRLFLILILIIAGLSLSTTACIQPQPTPSQISVGCSVADLIQAIHDANANSDPTEIYLGFCEYELTSADNSDTIHGITMHNGLPVIRSEIIIRGSNAMIKIDKDPGEPDFGHFFIAANGDLKLYDLYLLNGIRPRGGSIVNKGGKLFVYDVTFRNNSALPEDFGDIAHGGAIYSDAGEVQILASSLFQDNRAGHYGTVNNSHGGAVFSRNGSLLINDSSFLLNLSAGRGGAVYTEKSAGFDGGDPVTFQDVDFRENIARQDGGGAAFINEAEEVIIVSSLFSQNAADDLGGGIFGEGTALALDYSRLNVNTAAHGAAVYIKRPQEGDRSQLRSEKSDFENNAASEIGGAIFSENADLVLDQPKFLSNQALSCGAIRIGGGPGLDIMGGDLDTAPTVISSSKIDSGSFGSNTASSSHGGGLCHLMGNLVIESSSFNNNFSAGYGGGVFLVADAEIVGTNFTANHALNAGAIMIGFPDPHFNSTFEDISYLTPQITIENSIINSNHAENDGGGLFSFHNGSVLIHKTGISSNSAVSGGGLFIRNGDLLLTNSTLSGNQAASGGGLGTYSNVPPLSTLEMIHTTVAYNTAVAGYLHPDPGGGGLYLSGNVLIEKSLVTKNTPSDCAKHPGLGETFDLNVDSDGTCGFWETMPNPLLGPYSINVHPVTVGSPLINILPVCGFADDLPGTTRPQGSGCEPGSYEHIAPFEHADPDAVPLDEDPNVCDIETFEVISLTMLSVNPETMTFPLYVRFPDAVPGLDQADNIPYQAYLGDTEAKECNTQGFTDRLYCMFTLPESVPGTWQSFQLFRDDCEDPIYTHPKLTIPEVNLPEDGSGNQPSPTCRKDLNQSACTSAGGFWLDIDKPYCVCP